MVTHEDFNAQVVTESTTARTVTSKDTNKMLRTSNGSATTLTIADDTAGNFGDGTVIEVMQGGAGQITVAGDSGVTVRGTPTLKSRAQYSVLKLKKFAANEWVVSGDLAAS